MKTGVELIAEERMRQVQEEGWDAEHDDRHKRGELARAAALYASPTVRHVQCSSRGGVAPLESVLRRLWPWDWKWWKPTPEDRVRALVNAGALIAAELEREQRRQAEEEPRAHADAA